MNELIRTCINNNPRYSERALDDVLWFDGLEAWAQRLKELNDEMKKVRCSFDPSSPFFGSSKCRLCCTHCDDIVKDPAKLNLVKKLIKEGKGV